MIVQPNDLAAETASYIYHPCFFSHYLLIFSHYLLCAPHQHAYACSEKNYTKPQFILEILILRILQVFLREHVEVEPIYLMNDSKLINGHLKVVY